MRWSPAIIPHRLCPEVLDLLLPVAVKLAELDLAERPAPPLYVLARARLIRYIPDRLGVLEEWLTPRWILQKGGADCKSLVAWRVAELHRAGDSAATFDYIKQGDLFHIFVRRGDSKTEDPSTMLGMRFPSAWVWPD